MPKSSSEKTANYQARMKARGFVRVPTWVPDTKESRAAIQASAARLRQGFTTDNDQAEKDLPSR